MQFRILYRDEYLVAVDKPAGFHVHPPEDQSHRISRNTNCLALLRDQLGTYLYPVHRLDRATSGVLLYALTSEVAASLNQALAEGGCKKSYFAVVRGWTEDQGVIDGALPAEHEEGEAKPSRTEFRTLSRIELPAPVGRYPTSRYSLLQARPVSGRKHQIRRHFAHLAHPLIGDTVYGDGAHNRHFRKLLGEQALLLKSQRLELKHPVTHQPLQLNSRWNGLWHQVFDLFGLCPWQSP